MSGDRSLPALLQQENADLQGRVADLEAELRLTEGDLAVTLAETTRARSDQRYWEGLWRKAANGCLDLTAERDAARAELRCLAVTLWAARDYVDVQWGRAEAAAEQVRRIDASGVAQAFADLADILGSDQQDEQR